MSDLSPDTIPELAHGWTRERKTQFLDHLARRGNVRAACKLVGLSREAAYRLRRRDAQFARGWAAAKVLAHDAGLDVLADRAIDGVEEDVWYRGELVGTRRKYDTRLLLAHLARLDKALEDKAAQRDAARFDELLACIAGETVPEWLHGDDEVLPLDREEAARDAAARAEDRLREATLEETGKEPTEEASYNAFRGGHYAGKANWDAWYDNACGYVDWLCGWDNGVRIPPMWAGPEGENDEGEASAGFDPGTVSNVSTGAAGDSLAERGDKDDSGPPETPDA